MVAKYFGATQVELWFMSSPSLALYHSTTTVLMVLSPLRGAASAMEPARTPGRFGTSSCKLLKELLDVAAGFSRSEKDRSKTSSSFRSGIPYRDFSACFAT
jgi:hypothetical protein